MTQDKTRGAVLVGPRQERRAIAIAALCAWAEDSATDWQDSAVLAGLVWRSGRVFCLAGDVRQAERRWARAAEINRARIQAVGQDTEELAVVAAEQQTVLAALDLLYHGEKRLRDAVEVETEFVELHTTRHDADAVAQALLRVGATLVAAQRFAEAGDYLTRADRAFRSLGERTRLLPALARDHAQTLDLLATVHRQQDDANAAAEYDQRATEAAAAPLVHHVEDIHGLRDTLTTLTGQASAFADDVAAVAADVGEGSTGGLALAARVADGWRDRKDTVQALISTVAQWVGTIAERAGRSPVRADKDTLINAVSELTSFAEESATSRKAPLVLIGLLERSGHAFDLCDPDYERYDGNATAERQWLRALRLSEAMLERANNAQEAAAARAEVVRFLELLVVHYRDQRRYSEQWDIEDELIDAYEQADNSIAAAHVRMRLARSLMDAGQRLDAAEDYLVAAEQAFHDLGELDADTAAQHAVALDLLATVHHHRGNADLARSCVERASALRQPHPAGVS